MYSLWFFAPGVKVTCGTTCKHLLLEPVPLLDALQFVVQVDQVGKLVDLLGVKLLEIGEGGVGDLLEWQRSEEKVDLIACGKMLLGEDVCIAARATLGDLSLVLDGGGKEDVRCRPGDCL